MSEKQTKDTTKSTPKTQKKRTTMLKMSHAKNKFKDSTKEEIYELKDGKSIKFRTFFLESEIEELLVELFENVKYAKENEIDFFENEKNFLHYIHFLLIKYFTHFKTEIADKLEDQIPQFRFLVETGYHQEIVNDALPQEEILKVIDRFTETSAKGYSLELLEEEARKKAANVIQNKDIFTRLETNQKAKMKK